MVFGEKETLGTGGSVEWGGYRVGLSVVGEDALFSGQSNSQCCAQHKFQRSAHRTNNNCYVPPACGGQSDHFRLVGDRHQKVAFRIERQALQRYLGIENRSQACLQSAQELR